MNTIFVIEVTQLRVIIWQCEGVDTADPQPGWDFWTPKRADQVWACAVSYSMHTKASWRKTERPRSEATSPLHKAPTLSGVAILISFWRLEKVTTLPPQNINHKHITISIFFHFLLFGSIVSNLLSAWKPYFINIKHSFLPRTWTLPPVADASHAPSYLRPWVQYECMVVYIHSTLRI